MLKSLWNYRYFIAASIRSELKGRFARSYLGGLWFILHPLAQALIFSIVLSEVMRAKLPNVSTTAAYPIYLLSGMAAWGLFNEILTRSITVFIDQGSVMKKISFPRLCLPIIILGSALLNQILLLLAVAIILSFFGHYPSFNWLYLFPGMIVIAAFSFGLGVTLGVLNVFVRDVGQVMIVIMQLWFWLTPIVYVIDIVPENYRAFIELNPMTHLTSIYQKIILFNEAPNLWELLPTVLLSLALIIVSFFIFRRASSELVDVL